MDNINKATENLDQAVDKADILATQMLVQFDTMAQLQMQERKELNELHVKEKSDLRKHYARIIWGLIAALVILIGGIVGGAFYIFTNFDFGVVTSQTPTIDGDGRIIVNDGIHLDPNGIFEGIGD